MFTRIATLSVVCLFVASTASARQVAGFAVDNGDVNGDLRRDVVDVVSLALSVYSGDHAPVPLALCAGEATVVENGDVDASGSVNLVDVVRLARFLFGVGQAPVSPCADEVGAARIVPGDAVAYGKSYGEWSATWWQWALEAPAPMNPVTDTTGEFCDVGQSGPVWFLAGNTSGEPGQRSCTVPAGKAVLFSLLNLVSWAPDDLEFADSIGTPGDTPEEKLLNLVRGILDGAGQFEASVDGIAIVDLEAFRFSSPPFPLTFVPDNIFGVTPGERDFAISDGYWVMLPPLPAGTHTIHFSAVFESGLFQGFGQDMTYELTVE